MRVRIHENISVGDVLHANIVRDKDDLKNYASRIDDAYINNHKQAVDVVRNMERVAVKTGQNKLFTRGLYAKVDGLHLPVFKLEGYVKHAAGLNLLDTTFENFGIHQVRTDIHQKDLEGLGDSLEILNQNVDHNKTVLLNEGLPQATIDMLIAVKHEIDVENAQQEMNKEDRNILAKGNEKLVDALIALNRDILDVGKRVYKGVDDAKYGDYVLVKLMKQIRHEGNATTEELDEIKNSGALYVNCKDAEGNPVADLTGKVVGKDDEAMSDDEGVLYFESITIAPGEKIAVEITGALVVPKTISGIELNLGDELEIDATIEVLPTDPA
jgi:DNA-binding phage protein